MTGRFPLVAGLFLWGALLQLTLAAPALGAAACHCFNDRSFDPAEPGRSDPYVLATTQNSFMAAAYGIPKGDIVLAKMDGAAGEDLWISHFVARKAHLNAESLLAAKAKALTWQNALDEREVPLAALGGRFREHLLRGDDVALLAALATCETVADRLGTSWEDLEPLLVLSASTGEIVTATLLGRWTGKKAASIYADVRAGNTTWGQQMHLAGVSPGKVEDAIRKLIR